MNKNREEQKDINIGSWAARVLWILIIVCVSAIVLTGTIRLCYWMLTGF